MLLRLFYISMDTIASCAFGMDAHSFDKEHESDFVKYAKNTSRFSNFEFVKFLCAMVIPLMSTLYKIFK